jgi:hypothetical protein
MEQIVRPSIAAIRSIIHQNGIPSETQMEGAVFPLGLPRLFRCLLAVLGVSVPETSVAERLWQWEVLPTVFYPSQPIIGVKMKALFLLLLMGCGSQHITKQDIPDASHDTIEEEAAVVPDCCCPRIPILNGSVAGACNQTIVCGTNRQYLFCDADGGWEMLIGKQCNGNDTSDGGL